MRPREIRHIIIDSLSYTLQPTDELLLTGLSNQLPIKTFIIFLFCISDSRAEMYEQ